MVATRHSRVLASVTFTLKVVPDVTPESKPLPLGVQGSLKEDSVTECSAFLQVVQQEELKARNVVDARENEGNQRANRGLDVRWSVS